MANYCSWTAWCCLCICRSRACQPLIIPSSNAFTRILCLLMWPIIHSSMVFTRVLYFLMWPKYLVVAEIFRCAIKASSKNCRSCSLNIFILTLFFYVWVHRCSTVRMQVHFTSTVQIYHIKIKQLCHLPKCKVASCLYSSFHRVRPRQYRFRFNPQHCHGVLLHRYSDPWSILTSTRIAFFEFVRPLNRPKLSKVVPTNLQKF